MHRRPPTPLGPSVPAGIGAPGGVRLAARREPDLDATHETVEPTTLDGCTDSDGEARCPLCRRPVILPDRCADGSRPLAECDGCDLLFDPDDEGA